MKKVNIISFLFNVICGQQTVTILYSYNDSKSYQKLHYTEKQRKIYHTEAETAEKDNRI